jgi:outer membrane protein OmpA-like peptidoglycan-associated protein/Tol biopolymer transport system component
MLIFLLTLNPSFSQELSTSSKKAKKAYMDGELALRVKNYETAKTSFLKATESDPEFFEAYLLLGDVYESLRQDSNAIVAYKRAVEIDPVKFPATFLMLGNLEYKNAYYEDALVHFEIYLQNPKIREETRLKCEKHMANCRFAIDAIANPVPFDPINLGNSINTERDEYFPCLTADNQTLLFTRLLEDRRAYTGRQEDFYTSIKSNDQWELALSIGEPINSAWNEGAPSLSADGNVLIFTACESVDGYGLNRTGFGRCDLFIANKHGNKWSMPHNMGGPINSRHWESQPSISADGRTLYFVSNRLNNYDIWVSRKSKNGVWSQPEMLNANINTDGYEGSVFIHPDNQTLYFSSDHHVGMGGMDIFVSRRDSTGDWGVPVNLGYPINTIDDENSIQISADGELAMFASDREGGLGGLDLYQFELYEEVRPEPVTYMKGIVFNSETHKKLQADFELIDLETGLVAVQSQSNAGNGEFLVCLASNHEYALNVSADGFLFYSENFNLTGENSSTDPVLKDVPLKLIKVGEQVVLKNIFFDSDKYELLKASEIELNKLIDLLNQNPQMKIEIGGHTDNVGADDYNLILSENRAEAVYNYLISQEISEERLSFKGYGESFPVDSNETEFGRANNRRTEFKVIE